MPSYIVDITVTDAAGGVSAEDVQDALQEHFPGSVIESWTGEDEQTNFWRVLTYLDERNFVEVLAALQRKNTLVREQLQLRPNKAIGVQLTVRDGRFDPYDAIPTRWSAGGRQGRTRHQRSFKDGAMGLAVLALAVAEGWPN